ncbi:hypothetical protein F0A16_11165 [Salinicola corii]|uniref:Uncharacterized protein n=1 Tax=Salinicola corii TaxID=2606937 RepID=A0A640WE98_9GAMM|nr:hypothetical protein [Salinicola corii]KAA0018269.1 hypothetical protein F0A16_11165 [Salinicola corii]
MPPNPLAATAAIRHVAPLLIATLLAGCQSSMGPMSWTSGYRQVAMAAPEGDQAATDGRMATLPNLCQSSPDDEGMVTLPPGCANDLNLQLMVANPQDLVRGREMGPPMAGPVADAARERLDDRGRANERRAMLEGEARSAMGDTATTDGL